MNVLHTNAISHTFLCTLFFPVFLFYAIDVSTSRLLFDPVNVRGNQHISNKIDFVK